MLGLEAWIFWLILLIFFAVAEAATVNLVTIWFAIGSLVAMVLALLDFSLGIQIVSMILISVASLLCFILIFKPKMETLNKGFQPTNADRIIHQIGVVKMTIDPMQSTGMIVVKGQVWSAISEEEKIIEKGQKVEVLALMGVKAVVKRYVEEKKED